MSREAILTKTIYPLVCFNQAAEAFEDLCSTSVKKVSEADYSIDIQSSSPEVNEQVLINEFLNYLLDLSVEQYFSQQQFPL